MRFARIFVILTVALFCVAATSLAHQGPGKSVATLFAGKTIPAGHVDVWNNGKQLNDDGVDIGSKLMVQVTMNTDDGWYMTELHIQAGFDDIPMTKKGSAIPGHFNCQRISELVPAHTCVFDLEDDFDFSWGSPQPPRDQRRGPCLGGAIDASMELIDQEGAWAKPDDERSSSSTRAGDGGTGTNSPTPCAITSSTPRSRATATRPRPTPASPAATGRAASGASPASGLTSSSARRATFPPKLLSRHRRSCGKKISPLDMYSGADTNDPRVIGVARVLQSLDSDGEKAAPSTSTPRSRPASRPVRASSASTTRTSATP